MDVTNAVIDVDTITKDYKQNRGLFDLNFIVNRGEVVGIVGQNGAGKSTTMRVLMGFIKVNKGKACINNIDVWTKANTVKNYIGYVPGEIDFPDTSTGMSFLKMQMQLLRNTNNAVVNNLIQTFKIDTTADLKRMSKGMKQKMALVYAFMTKAPILLLDEPTTGLDPVMRDAFIQLLLKCKKRGTTVLISSHMFNELEPTCDRILFLKRGKIIETLDQKKIKKIKEYQRVTVKVKTETDVSKIKNSKFIINGINEQERKIEFIVHYSEMNTCLRLLAQVNILDISFDIQNLNQYFEKELAIK